MGAQPARLRATLNRLGWSSLRVVSAHCGLVCGVLACCSGALGRRSAWRAFWCFIAHSTGIARAGFEADRVEDFYFAVIDPQQAAFDEGAE